MLVLVGAFVHFTMALPIEGKQKGSNGVLMSECVYLCLSVAGYQTSALKIFCHSKVLQCRTIYTL